MLLDLRCGRFDGVCLGFSDSDQLLMRYRTEPPLDDPERIRRPPLNRREPFQHRQTRHRSHRRGPPHRNQTPRTIRGDHGPPRRRQMEETGLAEFVWVDAGGG